MKAFVQRITSGSVRVGDEVVGEASRGIAVLVAIHRDDTADDMNYIARKLLGLRLWSSDDGQKTWDRNIKQIDGDILLISQFTLMHVLKGNKPDFHMAMDPEEALKMFNTLRDTLKNDYFPDR
ncbi:D-aminoacyl-tRNA deacylase DTD [Trypanosoma melophagium]|nr:D-aminoacyl-tRNA deacylase DTD [Trypanosoma melophagium]KAH9599438.1 D-aminoacyl-tRNA deacylase DTD [Trypanosoma melophagium]